MHLNTYINYYEIRDRNVLLYRLIFIHIYFGKNVHNIIVPT